MLRKIVDPKSTLFDLGSQEDGASIFVHPDFNLSKPVIFQGSHGNNESRYKHGNS